MTTAPTRVPARRRWPRRVLIGLNIFVALCVLLAGSLYLYVEWKFGKIEKIPCSILGLRDCEDEVGGPMNVLLVGSDSRANITEEERVKFGTSADVGGVRSDTMMVLHVDPREQRAAILSIPRDLYLPIVGRGNDRINTAISPSSTRRTVRRTAATTTTTEPVAGQVTDGAPRLIATIRRSLGIEIDHYIEVDFVGFRRIVDAVGGVTIPFPSPARDRLSGLRVTRPGCVELDGDQALAYARSRNYQTFESGRWRGDPSGDLGRIERQQDFIRRVMRRAIARTQRNPLRINSLIDAGIESVTFDDGLGKGDLFRIGKEFRSLEPNTVDMLTLPTTSTRINGASVLRLAQGEARAIIDRFNGIGPDAASTGPPPNVLPSTVRVRVLNGSGVGGQAGQVARALQREGFRPADTGDAGRFNYMRSEIRYGRGQRLKAQLLQAYVQGGADLKEDLTIRGVDLVLVTGSAFAGVRKPGTAGSSTTATTAPAKPAPQGATAPLDC